MRYVKDCIYEINDRGAPGSVMPKVFLSDELLPKLEEDAITQLVNVSRLPGCVASLAMPDVHKGYGFTVGGVGAFKLDTGVITPMGVGYDINCGVRLLTSDYITNGTLSRGERSLIDELIKALYKKIPSGFDRNDDLSLNTDDVIDVFLKGPEFMVKQGYGRMEDVAVCEEHGRMRNARVDETTILPKEVSGHNMSVYERSAKQMGTLGGGNHFLEIQMVTDIYDDAVAKNFGLAKGMITVMIHSGSRGAGHQICEGHHRLIGEKMGKYYDGKKPSDEDLTYVPIRSDEGQNYWDAMACGANFGWANRHTMGALTMEEAMKILGMKLTTSYDVTHNIAKKERHMVDGSPEDLLIVRKGATRAFPGYRSENPEKYSRFGHPVLIPGSMGTSSYVLVGTDEGMNTTFGSVNHGAGRAMSREKAKKVLKGVDVTAELAAKGITVVAPPAKGRNDPVREEAPQAYKDIDAVIDVDVRAGIAKLVARMVPIAVMKG